MAFRPRLQWKKEINSQSFNHQIQSTQGLKKFTIMGRRFSRPSRFSKFSKFSKISRFSRRINFRVIIYSWNQLLFPGQCLQAGLRLQVHSGWGLSSTCLILRIFNSKSFTSKITKISIETMMLQSHSQSETLTHIHWHLFLYLHVSKVVIIMFLFHLVGRPAGFQLYRVTSSGPDPMMKTLMSDSHTCFVGCQNQHIAKRLDLP